MSDRMSSDALPGSIIRPGPDAADEPVPAPAERQRELAQLYRSHAGRLQSYFRRCGMAEAVARDLVQETFVSALRGLHGFQGGSKLSTWVWAIARNALRMHLRSQPPELADLAGESLDPDVLTSPHGAHPSVMDDCVRRGFARFAASHPERAQVIYLAVVEGWTRDELAEFLGRTPHAATEYLSQCKAKLKPFLEGCDGC